MAAGISTGFNRRRVAGKHKWSINKQEAENGNQSKEPVEFDYSSQHNPRHYIVFVMKSIAFDCSGKQFYSLTDLDILIHITNQALMTTEG